MTKYYEWPYGVAVVHPREFGGPRISWHTESKDGRKFHVGFQYENSISEEKALEVMKQVADLLNSIGAYGGQEWSRMDILTFPEDAQVINAG